MKLLKQFDPVPHYEFDDEGLKAKMRRGKRRQYTYTMSHMRKCPAAIGILYIIFK